VYDASFSVLHDRELSGQLYGYDQDGNAITARLVAGPAHGTLALGADGTFTCTPNTHYVRPTVLPIAGRTAYPPATPP